MTYGNWRDDPGLESHSYYEKRFAITPVISHDGQKIWFKKYYKKYKSWSHTRSGLPLMIATFHRDFVENITEEEYIVRKLSESL